VIEKREEAAMKSGDVRGGNNHICWGGGEGGQRHSCEARTKRPKRE